ncbi:DUF1572 family protein [Paenibacillus aquistagni]|uniref:DUF1572 family protein n=1 Tax=Paenibacillus aquistagni TaxID=1852522 RepID=UPI000B501868|nr:DUF1572 family protein [Paenibacillus aquistagni]NMM51056.1 DUF1572 family protein [Paenibacillus aquistagni]
MTEASPHTLGESYLTAVKNRFSEVKKNGDQTFLQLQEQELFWSPHEDSNSISVIVKHMSGNMISRWTNFLTTDGEKPDRHRDDEFAATLSSKEEMLQVWEHGWSVFLAELSTLTPDDLLRTITIRNQPMSVIDAIERQVAHYAYHVGQIVFIAKLLKGDQWQTLTIPRRKSN